MLSFEEAKRILSNIAGSSKDVVLVGGQAIEFWRRYYHIESMLNFLTKDIDFYGDSASADQSFLILSSRDSAQLYIADIDDASPNIAKITFKNNQSQVVEIDYLFQITGLSNDDIESFSPVMMLDDAPFKVLHPILCLESKISNLAIHPIKRNKEGIEQARLSVEIARSFIQATLKESGDRSTYELIERIGRFAGREPAKFSFYRYQIDVLNSIPIDDYPDNKFKSTRYPQIIGAVEEKRMKFAQLMLKRNSLYDVDSMRFNL